MKRLSILCFVLLTIITGCGGSEEKGTAELPAAGSSFPMHITDSAGRTVVIEKKPERILSLAPANTEILFALGLGKKVVGVTDFCDYPPEAKDKKSVGDFYGPSIEAAIALEPDIIFAAGGVQLETAAQLEQLGQTVVIIEPQSIQEVIRAVELIGNITGSTARAGSLAEEMQDRTDAVVERLRSSRAGEPVETFIIVWGQDNQLFTAGENTFISNLLEVAGGVNTAAGVPGDYPVFSVEGLLEEDPDVIISIDHQYKDPEEVKQVLHWEGLTALKTGRVYVVSDPDLVTLPGPRVVEGLEVIARYLHPECF